MDLHAHDQLKLAHIRFGGKHRFNTSWRYHLQEVPLPGGVVFLDHADWHRRAWMIP
jgi:hypothetical protein